MYNKISVLMSLYDKESPYYLENCFASLERQTLPADEIVLVLDGPINRGLFDVVSAWKDKLPLKLIPLEDNVGLSKALNIGLRNCTHGIVARMDTDDICHAERFQKQIGVMMSNNIDICGTWAIDIDEEGHELNRRKVPTSMENIRKSIWSCPMIHPSVMFKKESILSVGSYNPDAPHRQDDYELWIRSMDAGLIFCNCPEYLVYYRFPIGSERKNTFLVGVNRFVVGFPAVIKYDFTPGAILGILFPMIRPFIPNFLRRSVMKLTRKYDPRQREF